MSNEHKTISVTPDEFPRTFIAKNSKGKIRPKTTGLVEVYQIPFGNDDDILLSSESKPILSVYGGEVILSFDRRQGSIRIHNSRITDSDGDSVRELSLELFNVVPDLVYNGVHTYTALLGVARWYPAGHENPLESDDPDEFDGDDIYNPPKISISGGQGDFPMLVKLRLDGFEHDAAEISLR